MKILTQLWRLLVIVPFLMFINPHFGRAQGASQVSDSKPEKSTEQSNVTRIDYGSNHGSFLNLFSEYQARYVPSPRLDNSRRLQDLVVGDKLMLGLEDAIALALENNLDIEVARYNLPIAQTDLLRAKGGGATRGVAGAYQSTTLFSGSLGGGVSNNGNGGGGGAGGTLGGTNINSISSNGCCDPSVYAFYGGTAATTPLNYTVVSGVPVETSHFSYFQAGYSQGFVSGTNVGVYEYSYRLASNTTTSLYDPEFVTGLSVGFTQNLLNGFGARANARFIRIGRNNLKYSMSVFRQSVIAQVAAVMTTYYDLLADQESIRVAQGKPGVRAKAAGKQPAGIEDGRRGPVRRVAEPGGSGQPAASPADGGKYFLPGRPIDESENFQNLHRATGEGGYFADG